MPLEIFNCEQGTQEWFDCRKGIPTASSFATVMAQGRGNTPSKGRAAYMQRLALEVITNKPQLPTFSNEHTERGHAHEDRAREVYCYTRDVQTQRVGFIRNGNIGCSPDSLVSDDGGLEIKCPTEQIQKKRIALGQKLPPEYKGQVHGCMYVTGRDWWDFVSYFDGMEAVIIRVERDDVYIRKIAEACAAFNDELAELIEKMRREGVTEQAA
jgi:putative phage-type endonuclease